MDAKTRRLAVIGGGAAGLVAAIAAGERARSLGVPISISVYERDDRVGRSILATGNGRCNFSNSRILVGEYHNHEFVAAAFDALASGCDYDPVHDFLESCGLEWREESDGRRYPLANKASSVVDVLRAAAAREGVVERCEAQVSAVDLPREPGKPFTLRMKDGVFERADAVVVACGGRALSALSVEGLRPIKQHPVLGPLKCAPGDVAFTRELDNIRVKCAVRLFREDGKELVLIGSESGELMLRKYGVSGICVFNLSRRARPGDWLQVDFLNMSDPERARDYMAARRKELVARFGGQLTFEDMTRGLVLPRVAEAVLKRAGLKPTDVCTKAGAAELAELLNHCMLQLDGIADESLCQVRRGGYPVSEFDPATMQSAATPGLFAVGEAVDVDGPCGGYNLHWAWASGLLAGRAAADACAGAR